jgi:hypothetical protein
MVDSQIRLRIQTGFAARPWHPAAHQDRFKYQIDLSLADIREVAAKRVLSKRTEKEGMLRQIVLAANARKISADRS